MASNVLLAKMVPLFVGVCLTASACGTESPTSAGDDQKQEQTSAAAPPTPEQPTAAATPTPTSSPTPDLPSVGPSKGVVGARDEPQPGLARAVRMCVAVVGDGHLQSAFLTTVGQVRSSSVGPVPESRVALWPSLPASAPAAWCSVRSGSIFTMSLVGPDNRVQPFMTAKQPINPNPLSGRQGPAVP